jgi:4-hydroxythreonine-4-phosphate dehydrogenase
MERKNNDDRPIIGISHGDINGINYEIIIKVLEDKRIYELYNCVLYGSSKALTHYQTSLGLQPISFQSSKRLEQLSLNSLNLIQINDNEIKIDTGKSTEMAGKMAYEALRKSVSDLSKGDLDALVTAPIDKSNIQSDEFKFAGHTDYLAAVFQTKDYLMFLVSNNLRVGVVTGHIPISKVAETITTELIMSRLMVMHKSLKIDFGIRNPRIAVLGLNPHASDSGLIGNEEEKKILPAIEKAQRDKMLVYGPYPADGFFASDAFQKFDGILAMYHDQGLIPFKSFSFKDGVNFTAGLPVVRTSPDHGVAFDIAGKNKASEDSLRQAIYLAAEIVHNRKEHEFYSKNPLKTKSTQDSGKDEDISSLLEQLPDSPIGLSI